METMQPDAVVLHCPQAGLTAADAYAKVRALTKAPVVLLVGSNEPLAAEFTDGSAHGVLVLRRPLRLPELVDALHTVMSPADPASALGSLGSEVLAVGDVILDERAHAVKVRGELINVPGTEFELLRVLLGFAGEAISRERIIELVWGTDIGRGRQNLYTHMKRLRHRIERDPANPEYIIPIRGYGWRFAAPSNNNDIA
jgi:two-component system response regulator RegX3